MILLQDLFHLSQETKEVERTVFINNTSINVAIKQYLPLAEKLELINNVHLASIILTEEQIPKYDDLLEEIFFNLEVIKRYTNIETNYAINEIYDLFSQNNLFGQILSYIPFTEINYIKEGIVKKKNQEFEFWKIRYGLGMVLNQITSSNVQETFNMQDLIDNISTMTKNQNKTQTKPTRKK